MPKPKIRPMPKSAVRAAYSLIKPRKQYPGGPRSHLVIPDTQCKPEAPIDHLGWLGRYIMDRRPDVIVHLGDHWDMPSCSSHETPVQLAEKGRRIKDDIDIGKQAMRLLLEPLRRFNARQRKGKRYEPRRVFLLANHENRLHRKIDLDPTWDGVLGDDPFGLRADGWKVQPFLCPIVIDGIAYSHFFPRSGSGMITQTRNGAPNALAMIKREMRSCTAGHQQGISIAPYHAGGGRTLWGLIAGSFYRHREDYLTPEGNDHWHGVVVKHEVYEGRYDPMLVSLDYLQRKYA